MFIVFNSFHIDERLEDFILTKLDQKTTQKIDVIEQLAQSMSESGNDFGVTTAYGSMRPFIDTTMNIYSSNF
jgi:hypothetical protein